MNANKFLNDIVSEIQNNLLTSNQSNFQLYSQKISSKNLIYLLFRSLTNQQLRNKIAVFINSLKKGNDYYDKKECILDIKRFSLDYYDYIRRNKNLKIPLEFFPKKDHQKMLDFLRILIYVLLFEKIPVDELGKDNWEQYKKAYGLNDKIKVKNGYFELLGFKSIKPNFEAIFCDYGLGNFKRKYGGVAFDLGAFVGDTAYLINKLKNPQKIYAFEPDPDNMEILKENLKLNNLEDKVIPVPFASGAKNGSFYLTKAGGASQVSKEKGLNKVKVKVVTIDDFVAKNNIKKVDLIKMDIEGAEFDTLKGAVKTLKRDKPDLIITIYHKGEHFFEIPGWLKKQVPEYNLRFLAFSSASPIIERAVAASV